jgi:hypothetical protein
LHQSRLARPPGFKALLNCFSNKPERFDAKQRRATAEADQGSIITFMSPKTRYDAPPYKTAESA